MMKVYCRIYQGVMKIGMYFLPWKMPETLEGADAIKRLPAWIKEKGFKNVLIVTDHNLVKLHLLDSLFEKLQEEELHYVLYDGIEPNPTDVNVEEGVALYLKHHCDAMIAFGGGSPMDCAKGIGAGLPSLIKAWHSFKACLRF